MKFLIQKNLYSGTNEVSLINCLRRMGCEYYYFNYIPFVGEIVFEENFEYDELSSYWIFGSVNSARVFESKYLKYMRPGTFFNSNFDFRVYSKIWGDYLLNIDSDVQNFQSSEISNFPCFIRPCEDSKLFNAGIFTKDDWEKTKVLIFNYTGGRIIDEFIQISSIKKIFAEVRCFVMNRKVLTASVYRRNNKFYREECLDEDILEFAQNRVDEWVPIDNFVIDIARTENGLKIIEIGCINCAGFYDINIGKFIGQILNLEYEKA